MKYGICNLSIVPLRAEASDRSELVSQVLYGETFKVLESRKKWCRIRLHSDSYEGWIDTKQFIEISKDDYNELNESPTQLSSDLVNFITSEEGQLLIIAMGSNVAACKFLNHVYEGHKVESPLPKAAIIDTALLYLNSPYLWGGKTPFGIDCSGFTQMVYNLCGYPLMRDASLQASQGEALSFIEESEPGDLAFFDNEEGTIIHVGIIMEDHHIIHAHGKVRVDRLDQTGIFNREKRTHTHKLRVIKRII
jgi:cell wall-associated NlpC family hydrolase